MMEIILGWVALLEVGGLGFRNGDYFLFSFWVFFVGGRGGGLQNPIYQPQGKKKKKKKNRTIFYSCMNLDPLHQSNFCQFLVI
jgi:hypothetical protein